MAVHNYPISHRHYLWLSVAALVSASIYDAWPLGLWLNPYVALHGLASELESPHQPYHQVFVACDVVSSLLIVGLIYVIRRLTKHSQETAVVRRLSFWMIIFAAATIADALTPLTCDPSLEHCATVLHSGQLIAHGLLSLIATVAIYLSILVCLRAHPDDRLLRCLHFGYLILSLAALIAVLLPGNNSYIEQFYILGCSIWIAAIPFVVRRICATSVN
jgi:hypothetical protein